MDRRAILTTTGGSCAKPPSAGAWSSKCSPAPQWPPEGPETAGCRGQSGASSAAEVRPWQGLPTVLSPGEASLRCSVLGRRRPGSVLETGSSLSRTLLPPDHQLGHPWPWPPCSSLPTCLRFLLRTGGRLSSRYPSSLILGDLKYFLFHRNASPRPAGHSLTGWVCENGIKPRGEQNRGDGGEVLTMNVILNSRFPFPWLLRLLNKGESLAFWAGKLCSYWRSSSCDPAVQVGATREGDEVLSFSISQQPTPSSKRTNNLYL